MTRAQKSLDELNLEEQREQILESDPAERDLQRQSLLPTLRAASELLKSRIKRNCSQFRTEYRCRYLEIITGPPYTLVSEHYWAIVIQTGAAVALILDILVSAILSKNWLNLPIHFAILAGGVLGSFLSFLCKAGVGILSKAHNKQDLRRARRRLEFTSAVVFIANVVLIVIILSSRNPSERFADFILSLSGIAIGMLSIALPILTGALLALSHDLDWSYRYDSEFQKAKLRFAELLSFRTWCGEDVATETTSDVEESDGEQSSPGTDTGDGLGQISPTGGQ
jgi:hypothetical protein